MITTLFAICSVIKRAPTDVTSSMILNYTFNQLHLFFGDKWHRNNVGKSTLLQEIPVLINCIWSCRNTTCHPDWSNLKMPLCAYGILVVTYGVHRAPATCIHIWIFNYVINEEGFKIVPNRVSFDFRRTFVWLIPVLQLFKKLAGM